ncbi:MAG: glycosyltransferase [Candidatus Mcinerneyibacterium aminivorans]|uniref:Glycosyltransferase n=1 Tax=Candidatus Mcinerneyibacterium aminivorans TaxID=2703815 RepID=A0A5D0MAU3_9BACT|nr:MAG: glycosyltransferase [Candidatus Mcinerneyibacterium aminivorans]
MNIIVGMMMVILYISSVIYLVLAVVTLFGLLQTYKKTENILDKTVSIVIVARNEENSLGNTLKSINNLELSGLKWEVILVNDASNDDTLKIMKDFQKNNKNVKIINLKKKDDKLLGKKFGITKAVEKSSCNYIFMTDADCIVPKYWIKDALKYFTGRVGMLLGHIEYIHNSFKEKIENIETIAGSIFTFSWAFYNNSPYCRGGNMAFKKKAFEDINGYRNTPRMASGDDTFLLQKMREKFKIVPLFEKTTFIKTALDKTRTGRNERNKRKFAKNFLMRPLNLSLFLFGIFYHLLLLIFIFIFYNNIVLWLIIAVKTVVEYLLFIIGAIKMNRINYILLYPIFIIKLIYRIIYYSVAGILKGYRWKSEKEIH